MPDLSVTDFILQAFGLAALLSLAYAQRRWLLSAIGWQEKNESLDLIVPWIAKNSAWSRWQTAQGATTEDQMRLYTAAAVVRGAAIEGRLKISARRRSETKPEELFANFWELACFDVKADPVRIWKITLRPCDGLPPDAAEKMEKIMSANYVELTTKWSEVKAIWPEKDRDIDAAIKALLKMKARSGIS
jgi:hypothetical protein